MWIVLNMEKNVDNIVDIVCIVWRGLLNVGSLVDIYLYKYVGNYVD